MDLEEKKFLVSLFEFFLTVIDEEDTNELSIILFGLQTMSTTDDPRQVAEYNGRILSEIESYSVKQVERILKSRTSKTRASSVDSMIRVQGGT